MGDFIYFKTFYALTAMQSLAMLPMMTEETADSKFSLLLEWNVVINFAILKSLWVLAIMSFVPQSMDF